MQRPEHDGPFADHSSEVLEALVLMLVLARANQVFVETMRRNVTSQMVARRVLEGFQRDAYNHLRKGLRQTLSDQAPDPDMFNRYWQGFRRGDIA